MSTPAPRPLVDLHTRDGGGLVWGYRLAPPAPIGLASAKDGAVPIWLHFNLADSRARTWLSEHGELPDEALAIMVEPHPRIRLHATASGVVGVVEDLFHDFDGDPESFGELRFYVDERRVISGRRRPLRSVDVLHRSLLGGEEVSSTGEWLESLVDTLANSFADAARELLDRVDHLEDDILAGQSTHEQRATLGSLRRLAVRFRRHVHRDRQALQRLRSECPASLRFESTRQGIEHLEGVAQDLDLLNERVRLLQEEVSGLLAEATNRNTYVLSIVTTALLPATLLTGFWGMNVGGLPWSESAHGGLWSALTVVASVLLSLALLRGSRVL